MFGGGSTWGQQNNQQQQQQPQQGGLFGGGATTGGFGQTNNGESCGLLPVSVSSAKHQGVRREIGTGHEPAARSGGPPGSACRERDGKSWVHSVERLFCVLDHLYTPCSSETRTSKIYGQHCAL